jgi:rhamnose transport system permease protein
MISSEALTVALAPSRRAVDLLLRFRELGIALVLVLLAAGLTGYSSAFLASSNLRSILLDVTALSVLALGQTVVILTRNFDLTVGSVVGLSAMSVGIILRDYPHMPVVWAFPIGIAVGFVPGLVNGLVVAYARIPSIIFTLGMLSVLRGLVYLISHNRQINANEVPSGLVSVSDTKLLGIPGSTFIALGLAIAVAALLRGTRTGRSMYAIGSNPRAAELHGLPTRRLLVSAFCLSGSLAGLTGVLFLSRFSFAQVTSGADMMLTSIAAVVVGGASIFGGSGSVAGTVLGCLLLTVIANGFAVANLSVYWQDVVYGGLIVLAVAIDSKVRGIGERTFVRRVRIRGAD